MRKAVAKGGAQTYCLPLVEEGYHLPGLRRHKRDYNIVKRRLKTPWDVRPLIKERNWQRTGNRRRGELEGGSNSSYAIFSLMSGRTSQGVFSRLFTIYAKRELSLVFFSATELDQSVSYSRKSTVCLSRRGPWRRDRLQMVVQRENHPCSLPVSFFNERPHIPRGL
jgi:hypothetical protein